MNDQTFNSRFTQLENSIQTLPADQRDRLIKLAEETQSRHDQIKKAIKKRNEYMERMQLALSYLMFDLEATKRENVQMKNKLINFGNQNNDSDSMPN